MIHFTNKWKSIFPLFFSFLLFAFSSQSISKEAAQPNVILIMADDQGWGDLGFNGNKIVDTKNLDSLFSQSVVFDRFYVSPVCSPTRASLLTGRHSLATGVFSVTRGGEKISIAENTIAELLQDKGYSTGIFGKWHNGLQYPYSPNGQGFDEFYGFADGHITRYFDGKIQHNAKAIKYTGYLPDRLTDAALSFIEKNKHTSFFTYLSFNTPHSPYELPKTLFEKYQAKGIDNNAAAVYGMMENLDDNVGRVLLKIKSLGIEKNTIVIYLSDNGPAFGHGHHRFNGHMKGWKGKVDEGGVRVPFAIYWPEKYKATKIDTIAQHIDVVPTILDLVGLPIKSNIHGLSLLPLLNSDANSGKTFSDRMLFTHHFRNTTRPDQQPVQHNPGAVRQGNWIAVLDETDSWYLFDVKSDPSQKNNLAEKNKDVLRHLSSVYDNWYEKTVAEHGAFRPLPIHIGYKNFPETFLPAHEGELQGTGIDYKFKYGWSHDWITTIGADKSVASWPISIMQTGKYHLYIGYFAPADAAAGQVALTIGEHTLKLNKFKPYIAAIDEGKRLSYTDEAPAVSWKEYDVGQLNLTKGDSSIKLIFNDFDPQHSLNIGYIRVVYKE